MNSSDIFRLIDENNLAVDIYRLSAPYISRDERWQVSIESNLDGECIKVKKRGESLDLALREAWQVFERMALMGKPNVLTPLLEHYENYEVTE